MCVTSGVRAALYNSSLEERMPMTTFRKCRFPVRMGCGLIAAGAFLCLSAAPATSGQISGSIGKRDVYREVQVDTSDIASPGQAPVAKVVISRSGQFEKLTKDGNLVVRYLKSGALEQGMMSLTNREPCPTPPAPTPVPLPYPNIY